MHPLILVFADGTTFFVGLAMVLLAEVGLWQFRNRFGRLIFTVSAILGIMLVLHSATPFPIGVYVLWTALALVGLLLLYRAEPPRRLCWIWGGMLMVVSLWLCFTELPYHRRPSLRVSAQTAVYVLGDSISAGMGTYLQCWPAVLAEKTSLRVVNLAEAGAMVENAISQAKDITDPRSLVIVEIGGNDLLGGTAAADFHTTLDELVSSLRANDHDVLLLELPLFPYQNAFGLAQREVAKRYGCALLPKRCFTRVLGTPDGTLDGLHLSQTGHQVMAEIIADVLTGP